MKNVLKPGLKIPPNFFGKFMERLPYTEISIVQVQFIHFFTLVFDTFSTVINRDLNRRTTFVL